MHLASISSYEGLELIRQRGQANIKIPVGENVLELLFILFTHAKQSGCLHVLSSMLVVGSKHTGHSIKVSVIISLLGVGAVG